MSYSDQLRAESKAVVQALKDVPAVNAEIDGTDLISSYKAMGAAAAVPALAAPGAAGS